MNWFSVESVQRKGLHFHYMKVALYDSYGQIKAYIKFKSWK